MNDQWIPGPPSKPPTWTVNPLPPSNAWDQTEGCAAESGPAIVEGVTITGVPATVSSLYWQVSLNDGSSPPNFQINALDGAGNFVSTAAQISPTTINLDYPVLLSRDPVEPMEAVTLEYLEAHAEFPEAPMDNYSYARYMATWERLPQAYIPEAPNTSQRYGRFNSIWQLDAIQTDAAADGNAYGRLNNAWTPVIPTTGGTITGSLTVNQVLTVQGSNSLVLNAPVTGGSQRTILGMAANVARWGLTLGDGTAEGPNNVGANFTLAAYSTTGAFLGNWLTIARADGSTVFNGTGITVNGGLAVNGLLAVNSLGNFYLPGGSAGQFLSTNGSGLLSWATPAGGGPGGPPVTISATPPLAPAVGALWWDSVGGQLYIWYSDPNTSQWVIAVNAASQGSGGAAVAIGDTPPASPQVGALWWDSVHGQFYLFFNDGNSTQWVPTTNQMGGGYLPLTGGSLSGGLTATGYLEADGVGATPIGGASNINGALRLNKAVGGSSVITGYTNGSQRWQIYLGTNVAESGGNAGSDFQINNYSDTGGVLAASIIIPRATGAVNIYGTSTNDNAAAGYVGEVISNSNAAGTLVTSNAPVNLMTLALTPGDWDLSAEAWFSPSVAGAMTAIWAAISSVSAVIPNALAINTSRAQILLSTGAFTTGTQVVTPRTCRVSLATAATYYLVVQATFSSGNVPVQGLMWARRAR